MDQRSPQPTHIRCYHGLQHDFIGKPEVFLLCRPSREVLPGDKKKINRGQWQLPDVAPRDQQSSGRTKELISGSVNMPLGTVNSRRLPSMV